MFKIIKIFTCSVFFVICIGCSSSSGDPYANENLDQLARDDLFGESGKKNGITNETYQAAFDKAIAAEERGDNDKALYYYIQCLEFAPKDANVLFHIGKIHDKQGNHSIAIKAYTEALANDPTLQNAHQALGILQMDNRQYSLAQGNLQKAILLDQKRLQSIGTVLTDGYYTLDKESPITAYNASGIIEDINRNFTLARIYYLLALDIKPNSANILSNIGYSYYLTGNLTLSERYFRKAINIDGTFKRAWSNLGLVYARKGQYNRAIKTFKQVMEEYDAYNDLGYFLMLEGKLNDAEYFFQKSIDLSPSYMKKAYSNLEQVQLKKKEAQIVEQIPNDEINDVSPNDEKPVPVVRITQKPEETLKESTAVISVNKSTVLSVPVKDENKVITSVESEFEGQEAPPEKIIPTGSVLPKYSEVGLVLNTEDEIQLEPVQIDDLIEEPTEINLPVEVPKAIESDESTVTSVAYSAKQELLLEPISLNGSENSKLAEQPVTVEDNIIKVQSAAGVVKEKLPEAKSENNQEKLNEQNNE